VRNSIEDASKLGEQRTLVDGFDGGTVLTVEEAAHNTGGSRQRDLESRTGGNATLTLQPSERRVGVDGRIRVPEPGQPQVVGRDRAIERDGAPVEPVADVERGVTEPHEPGSDIEVVLLELDPVIAVAHLAVRDAVQPGTEMLSHGGEGRLGIRQIDAADEVCKSAHVRPLHSIQQPQYSNCRLCRHPQPLAG
jgi:hypothetical protein